MKSNYYFIFNEELTKIEMKSTILHYIKDKYKGIDNGIIFIRDGFNNFYEPDKGIKYIMDYNKFMKYINTYETYFSPNMTVEAKVLSFTTNGIIVKVDNLLKLILKEKIEILTNVNQK